MKWLLQALKTSRLVARGTDRQGHLILHYLLPDGRVLEVIRPAMAE